eukprot:TRINITY_DN6908_c0_g1_i2.p1 TRINITY_DN6908_c0_g1~~TRINITY_DN6908_c0_g1_i2.p1  ORF type:complete len:2969 (+),score=683.92 TRINITY_DN6908_c0_g1_i2:700-8907(+)
MSGALQTHHQQTDSQDKQSDDDGVRRIVSEQSHAGMSQQAIVRTASGAALRNDVEGAGDNLVVETKQQQDQRINAQDEQAAPVFPDQLGEHADTAGMENDMGTETPAKCSPHEASQEEQTATAALPPQHGEQVVLPTQSGSSLDLRGRRGSGSERKSSTVGSIPSAVDDQQSDEEPALSDAPPVATQLAAVSDDAPQESAAQNGRPPAADKDADPLAQLPSEDNPMVSGQKAGRSSAMSFVMALAGVAEGSPTRAASLPGDFGRCYDRTLDAQPTRDVQDEAARGLMPRMSIADEDLDMNNDQLDALMVASQALQRAREGLEQARRTLVLSEDLSALGGFSEAGSADGDASRRSSLTGELSALRDSQPPEAEERLPRSSGGSGVPGSSSRASKQARRKASALLRRLSTEMGDEAGRDSDFGLDDEQLQLLNKASRHVRTMTEGSGESNSGDDADFGLSAEQLRELTMAAAELKAWRRGGPQQQMRRLSAPAVPALADAALAASRKSSLDADPSDRPPRLSAPAVPDVADDSFCAFTRSHVDDVLDRRRSSASDAMGSQISGRKTLGEAAPTAAKQSRTSRHDEATVTASEQHGRSDLQMPSPDSADKVAAVTTPRTVGADTPQALTTPISGADDGTPLGVVESATLVAPASAPDDQPAGGRKIEEDGFSDRTSEATQEDVARATGSTEFASRESMSAKEMRGLFQRRLTQTMGTSADDDDDFGLSDAQLRKLMKAADRRERALSEADSDRSGSDTEFGLSDSQLAQVLKNALGAEVKRRASLRQQQALPPAEPREQQSEESKHEEKAVPERARSSVVEKGATKLMRKLSQALQSQPSENSAVEPAGTMQNQGSARATEEYDQERHSSKEEAAALDQRPEEQTAADGAQGPSRPKVPKVRLSDSTSPPGRSRIDSGESHHQEKKARISEATAALVRALTADKLSESDAKVSRRQSEPMPAATEDTAPQEVRRATTRERRALHRGMTATLDGAEADDADFGLAEDQFRKFTTMCSTQASRMRAMTGTSDGVDSSGSDSDFGVSDAQLSRLATELTLFSKYSKISPRTNSSRASPRTPRSGNSGTPRTPRSQDGTPRQPRKRGVTNMSDRRRAVTEDEENLILSMLSMHPDKSKPSRPKKTRMSLDSLAEDITPRSTSTAGDTPRSQASSNATPRQARRRGVTSMSDRRPAVTEDEEFLIKSMLSMMPVPNSGRPSGGSCGDMKLAVLDEDTPRSGSNAVDTPRSNASSTGSPARARRRGGTSMSDRRRAVTEDEEFLIQNMLSMMPPNNAGQPAGSSFGDLKMASLEEADDGTLREQPASASRRGLLQKSLTQSLDGSDAADSEFGLDEEQLRQLSQATSALPTIDESEQWAADDSQQAGRAPGSAGRRILRQSLTQSLAGPDAKDADFGLDEIGLEKLLQVVGDAQHLRADSSEDDKIAAPARQNTLRKSLTQSLEGQDADDADFGLDEVGLGKLLQVIGDAQHLRAESSEDDKIGPPAKRSMLRQSLTQSLDGPDAKDADFGLDAMGLKKLLQVVCDAQHGRADSSEDDKMAAPARQNTLRKSLTQSLAGQDADDADFGLDEVRLEKLLEVVREAQQLRAESSEDDKIGPPIRRRTLQQSLTQSLEGPDADDAAFGLGEAELQKLHQAQRPGDDATDAKAAAKPKRGMLQHSMTQSLAGPDAKDAEFGLGEEDMRTLSEAVQKRATLQRSMTQSVPGPDAKDAEFGLGEEQMRKLSEAATTLPTIVEAQDAAEGSSDTKAVSAKRRSTLRHSLTKLLAGPDAADAEFGLGDEQLRLLQEASKSSKGKKLVSRLRRGLTETLDDGFAAADADFGLDEVQLRSLQQAFGRERTLTESTDGGPMRKDSDFGLSDEQLLALAVAAAALPTPRRRASSSGAVEDTRVTTREESDGCKRSSGRRTRVSSDGLSSDAASSERDESQEAKVTGTSQGSATPRSDQSTPRSARKHGSLKTRRRAVTTAEESGILSMLSMHPEQLAKQTDATEVSGMASSSKVSKKAMANFVRRLTSTFNDNDDDGTSEADFGLSDAQLERIQRMCSRTTTRTRIDTGGDDGWNRMSKKDSDFGVSDEQLSNLLEQCQQEKSMKAAAHEDASAATGASANAPATSSRQRESALTMTNESSDGASEIWSGGDSSDEDDVDDFCLGQQVSDPISPTSASSSSRTPRRRRGSATTRRRAVTEDEEMEILSMLSMNPAVMAAAKASKKSMDDVMSMAKTLSRRLTVTMEDDDSDGVSDAEEDLGLSDAQIQRVITAVTMTSTRTRIDSGDSNDARLNLEKRDSEFGLSDEQLRKLMEDYGQEAALSAARAKASSQSGSARTTPRLPPSEASSAACSESSQAICGQARPALKKRKSVTFDVPVDASTVGTASGSGKSPEDAAVSSRMTGPPAKENGDAGNRRAESVVSAADSDFGLSFKQLERLQRASTASSDFGLSDKQMTSFVNGQDDAEMPDDQHQPIPADIPMEPAMAVTPVDAPMAAAEAPTTSDARPALKRKKSVTFEEPPVQPSSEGQQASDQRKSRTDSLPFYVPEDLREVKTVKTEVVRARAAFATSSSTSSFGSFQSSQVAGSVPSVPPVVLQTPEPARQRQRWRDAALAAVLRRSKGNGESSSSSSSPMKTRASAGERSPGGSDGHSQMREKMAQRRRALTADEESGAASAATVSPDIPRAEGKRDSDYGISERQLARLHRARTESDFGLSDRQLESFCAPSDAAEEEA